MAYFDCSALVLFKKGYDTLQIANITRKPEHQVLREINQARSAMLGKPYVYPPFHKEPLPSHAAPIRRAVESAMMRVGR